MPKQIAKPSGDFRIRHYWLIGLKVKSYRRDYHSIPIDMINHTVTAALTHLSLHPNTEFEQIRFRIWDLITGARICLDLLQRPRDVFSALLSSDVNAGNDTSIRNKLKLFSPVMDLGLGSANREGGCVQGLRGLMVCTDFPRLKNILDS